MCDCVFDFVRTGGVAYRKMYAAARVHFYGGNVLFVLVFYSSRCLFVRVCVCVWVCVCARFASIHKVYIKQKNTTHMRACEILRATGMYEINISLEKGRAPFIDFFSLISRSYIK